MLELKWEEFADKYKPVLNHICDSASIDGFMFETYGKEWDYVRKQDCHKVWTLIDGDSDKLWLDNGFHIVNRLGYIITEVGWKENEEILVEV